MLVESLSKLVNLTVLQLGNASDSFVDTHMVQLASQQSTKAKILVHQRRQAHRRHMGYSCISEVVARLNP